MKRVWRDYNLSIVLFLMFLVAWVGQTGAGWREFRAEQEQHGQEAQVFGETGYVWKWAHATLENWQSEFLQLFTMVVFTAFLIHKGSAESRDSNDKMQASLNRLEKKLRALTGRQKSAGQKRNGVLRNHGATKTSSPDK